jgi:hypothetical protein
MQTDGDASRNKLEQAYQKADAKIQTDVACMAEISTSDAKISTNQQLREQLDAEKLVRQGFEHRNAKLDKELQKRTVQENKIRNQVEMEFILEHEQRCLGIWRRGLRQCGGCGMLVEVSGVGRMWEGRVRYLM